MRFLQSVDASLIGLGTQMLSEVAAGVLIGYGLDYMLGTKNRWIVVGSISGVIVAMWTVVRVAMRLQAPRRTDPNARRRPPRQDADREPEEPRAGGGGAS